MELPAVFSRIPWQQPRYEDGWLYDCFGGRIPGYVHGEGWQNGPIVTGFQPAMDIELFEFEALFHAVLDAKDHFTMVELGCGYARWLLFAAGAVKRAHPGMTSTLIGVEADATHFQWATEVSRENDLNARLLHAVVDGVDSEVDFLVLDDPAHQYGQSIIYPWTKTYVEEHGMAFDSTKLPALSLKTLLADVDHVDYIDSDIQGAEADVFEAGADVLDAKVARVFIETHGEILERRLCALFARLGWRCYCNYGPYKPNATPFGTFDFVGGVQVFHNPRFMKFAKSASA